MKPVQIETFILRMLHHPQWMMQLHGSLFMPHLADFTGGALTFTELVLPFHANHMGTTAASAARSRTLVPLAVSDPVLEKWAELNMAELLRAKVDLPTVMVTII